MRPVESHLDIRGSTEPPNSSLVDRLQEDGGADERIVDAGTGGTQSRAVVKVGVLVPLSAPGWTEAGRQLLAGMELAVREVNEHGRVTDPYVELVVRDTAADPFRAVVAMEEFARIGVSAVAGEYHSVVARAAAARADALGMPFLCSSAVLDALCDEQTDWVARLAPAQSHGWGVYAEFLLRAGHQQIAVATQPSVYWATGTRILRDCLTAHGGSVDELDVDKLSPSAICNEVAGGRATALLLLVGTPDPAVSIVRAVRSDNRLQDVMLGAPAGQPEFTEWFRMLGHDGTAIPFLRYLPNTLSVIGARVGAALREQLSHEPSFVAFEGYDSITVLADVLGAYGADRMSVAGAWPKVTTEGTRGQIHFRRTLGISVWQWAWAPIQVVDRDPADPEMFRILHTGSGHQKGLL